MKKTRSSTPLWHMNMEKETRQALLFAFKCQPTEKFHKATMANLLLFFLQNPQ
jgi:hypothetical protein